MRFLAGVVTATTIALIWRRWGAPWTIYLFSRGDA